jgi:SagB-type dehydrogenase family enzyme
LNARQFHELTSHTPYSVRSSGHTLDWDIKPFPFKVYTDRPAVELPREFAPLAPGPLTLERLAALLYFTAGVTKKKVYGSGVEVLFRAAPSTGALYQTEVYIAAGDVEGLRPGLYHFCPGDFTLRRLRDDDVRGVLARAAADESLESRAAVVALTAIYWRNTWKYQTRGFRHLFWDSGTMLANLLATGDALALEPRVLTGFVDDDVNHVLGLDDEREAALELVALGPRGTAAAPLRLDAIALETMPLSSAEVDYPELREMLAMSRLASAADVRAWRSAHAADPAPSAAQGLVLPHAASARGLAETIQRRGSTRRFSGEPITAEQLGTALWAATRPIAADVPSGLVRLFLIVNAVDGVAPGAYEYRHEALALIRPGDFRDKAAHLCLDQTFVGAAAAVIFFLAPLDAITGRWGDRGYRLVNLEAGIAGGRAYLAAYSGGFGASGLTFYDQHVVEFFAPASRGLDAIFVTALGRSAILAT